MLAPPQKPVEIFVSYAHEDDELRKELEKHLLLLIRTGMITSWHDHDAYVGADWRSEIYVHLESAQIILLLVSPDYMASDNLYNGEMKRALERQASKEALLIPILLRPVDLQESPLGNLQPLPSDAVPVTEWSNRDLAFRDIIKHIRSTVDRIINSSKQSALPPSSNNAALPLSNNNKVVQAIIRQRSFEKEAIRKNATADIPIQDIAEDKLDFDVYVHALHDFIASQETSTPLTIGVHGPWGSGKSSLMRMLQNQLDRSLSSQEKLQRVTWTFFFFVTLPIWFYGHLLLLIFPLRSLKLRSELYNFGGQSYNIPPQTLNFWQKIRAWHNPVDPPIHPTIWFNAWKFDQEEQLWAALALEILDQMKQKQNFFQRIIFWFRLTYKRFSLLNFIKAVALPLFFGIIDWIYSSYTN